MGQYLSALTNGSLLKLNENGKPVPFVKLENDHYGSGSGVTLIRKESFLPGAFSASAQNYYIGCLLDSFCDGIWTNMLDENIRKSIIPAAIYVAEGSSVTTLHSIKRKAFALSCAEVGLTGWQTEGTAFSYFSDNSKRIAYIEDTETKAVWGLRSPASDGRYAYCVKMDGTALGTNVSNDSFAARPAFDLPSDILVSDSTDADGCYTVESVPGGDGAIFIKQSGTWRRL